MASDLELLGTIENTLDCYDDDSGGVPRHTWEALRELEERLRAREENPYGERAWPVALYEVANALFGGAVFNKNGRVHKAFNVKVQHAYRTWEDKYGPLTPEQAEYADELLISCFNVKHAHNKAYPVVHAKLDRIVHHERTHAGFLRRSSHVDVSDVLAELE